MYVNFDKCRVGEVWFAIITKYPQNKKRPLNKDR